MASEWFCYAFVSLKEANGFIADIAEGYRQRGSEYVQKWERPKRQKGGYWVAVCARFAGDLDALAIFYAGRRLERKGGDR